MAAGVRAAGESLFSLKERVKLKHEVRNLSFRMRHVLRLGFCAVSLVFWGELRRKWLRRSWGDRDQVWGNVDCGVTVNQLAISSHKPD